MGQGEKPQGMDESGDRAMEEGQGGGERPWGATVTGDPEMGREEGAGDAGVGGSSFAGTPAGPADAASQDSGAADDDDPGPS